MVQHDELNVPIGGCGRGPRAPVDQRNLAQEVARSQTCQALVLPLNDDVPADHYEELVAALALAHEDVAIMCLNVGGKLSQTLELGRVEAAEQRDVAQHRQLS